MSAAVLLCGCASHPPRDICGPTVPAYDKLTLADPRPNVVHLLTVDLTRDGVSVDVIIAPDPDGEGRAEAVLMTPGQLVEQSGIEGKVICFTNAGPWDAFPDDDGKINRKWFVGQHVYLHGYAAMDGVVRSPLQFNAPVLWFDQAGRATISDDPEADAAARGAEVIDAIAGFHWLIRDGKPHGPNDKSLHPRTAVGVNADGTHLVLIVVDGRQPGVSEGMNHGDLAALLLEHGCTDGINLDGGGSSVIQIRDSASPHGYRVMNRPSDMVMGRPEPRPLPDVLVIRAVSR